MSRVLIVDDMPASREAIAKLLRAEGYETDIARNGAEGLARLKQKMPDLILLDHMMPEVDGLTFLAGIRRFPKWKNLPVIMFTGLKDKNHAMRAENLGVREYLVKATFTMDQLLDHVRRHTANGSDAGSAGASPVSPAAPAL